MSLLINKSAVGLPHYALLEDGKMKWVPEFCESELCYGFPNAPNSVEPLFSLFGIDLKEFIPPSVKRSFDECGYSGEVPWSLVLPREKFKSLFFGLLKEIQDGEEKLNSSPYTSFFIQSNKIFSALSESTIDVHRCKQFLAESESHVLKSMLSMAKGSNRLPVSRYDRVSTKTGRLTIKAGPQVLTLKKEHRDVFIPSSPSRKLYEIDFVSLEPRVALCIAGKSVKSDVYAAFSEQSGLGVSRDVAKLAVLCALYGAGKYRLESVLREDNSGVSAHVLLKEVNNFFAVNNLSKSLVAEASSGFIHNCFGRPIEVDDNRNTMLVNNFLQSSAADIAILGFLDFFEKLNSIVFPKFIIHDALVFEADPKHIGAVNEYVNNGFELKEMGNFPLKITEFNSHE